MNNYTNKNGNTIQQTKHFVKNIMPEYALFI